MLDETHVDDVPEISTFQRLEDLLANEMPGVQAAIIFAELSCIFVAFVAYLLHSLPLWSRFSRGQQWCLIVSFTAASLYQVAVLSWYLDSITSDIMLGLSSLITRMISLGMVPITTTSFMGRARAACANDPQLAITSSSTTRSGRNHYPRARSG
uniref:Uncharacterized protein n=1 Tax=Globisporangium ultimum (strain ATCC 200006 / CBS 805.95 / DAOM BR144) TaxID=431595 RepID=K3WVN4_GLOUD